MKIDVTAADNGRLMFNRAFSELLGSSGIFSAESLWNFRGESVKKLLKERGTERVFLNGPSGEKVEAYIKRYTRVPVKQTVKAALTLKFKSFNAFDEWNSIIAFHNAGLPTMQPMAVAKCNDGTCSLALGITGYTKASEMFRKLEKGSPRRRALIRKIAALGAGMHNAGLAHQDFYLVHVFVRESEGDSIYLIDLQRVICGHNLSRRWIIKDLGQMIFSMFEYLSKREIMIFCLEYSRKRNGIGSKKDVGSLIRSAFRKANSIRRRHDRKR